MTAPSPRPLHQTAGTPAAGEGSGTPLVDGQPTPGRWRIAVPVAAAELTFHSVRRRERRIVPRSDSPAIPEDHAAMQRRRR